MGAGVLRQPPTHLSGLDYKEKAHNMEIKRNGTQPSGSGAADYFTGQVRIDPLHQADAMSSSGCSFSPWD